MKLQHFNLISIIGAVVTGVFGAFPVSVHAKKSPLIAMIAGGVGGALPVTVHAKKSPLVALLAAGVGISTLPVPVHANKSPLFAMTVGGGLGVLPVTVHAKKSPLIAMVAVGGALPVSVDAKKSPLVAVAVAAGVLPTVNAEKCKRGDYGCGKGRGTEPYWTDTCSENACCCGQTDLGGYHTYTCSDYESETKGCMSCLGDDACKHVDSTVKIGDQSCVNKRACKDVKGNSIIWNHSCRSDHACYDTSNVVIGSNSCGTFGNEKSTYACYGMNDSNVGSNSCGAHQACYSMTYSTVGSNSCGANIDAKYACENMKDSTVGSNSCRDYASCGGDSLRIGDNACNLPNACSGCRSVSIIPSNACSTPDSYDVIMDPSGRWKCLYCVAIRNVATVSASYSSTRRRLESAGDLEMDCEALALALLDYTDQSISEYAAFRELISGDACNGKYKNVFEFTADASTGTCGINLNKLWLSRPPIGPDESTGKAYIAERIREFEGLPPILEGFTLTSLAATDEEFECESDVSIKSGKSGKIAPAQAQTIDDGGSKSGKSGSGKEGPKRKRRRQPRK